MASLLRTIKYLLLIAIGSIAGMAVAIILRPSYPPGVVQLGTYNTENRPSVYMMIMGGIPGGAATERLALIYLLLGLLLGALAGFFLSRLTSRKRAA